MTPASTGLPVWSLIIACTHWKEKDDPRRYSLQNLIQVVLPSRSLGNDESRWWRLVVFCTNRVRTYLLSMLESEKHTRCLIAINSHMYCNTVQRRQWPRRRTLGHTYYGLHGDTFAMNCQVPSSGKLVNMVRRVKEALTTWAMSPTSDGVTLKMFRQVPILDKAATKTSPVLKSRKKIPYLMFAS